MDDFESGIAPWVRLTPKAISISANNRADGRSKTISIEASMWGGGWRQSLRMADDRDISKLEWAVGITTHDQINPHVREQGGIGVASYVPEYASEIDLEAWDESISAWVALPDDQFQLLADAVVAKLPITGISLSLAGASYSGAPDGSGKVWDVAKKRDLIIKEVNWTLAALASPEPNWGEDGPAEPSQAAASQQDIGILKDAVVARLDKLGVSIGWAAAAAIATAAILLFR